MTVFRPRYKKKNQNGATVRLLYYTHVWSVDGKCVIYYYTRAYVQVEFQRLYKVFMFNIFFF